MRVISKFLMLVPLMFVAPAFAADDMSMDQEPMVKGCVSVAKACKGAGFSGKEFWFKCMRPVLLNQSVDKVTVAADDVKACRDFKIKVMEKELDVMKKVK